MDFLLVLAAAVVAGPSPTDGEFVEAEHVHHADGGQGGSVELGPLGHAGADEEAAIAASADGEAVGRGVLVGDEPFGRPDKVVEDVLLLQFGAGFVPGFAVLAPTAEVGQGIDAAHFQPSGDGDREGGGETDVEAAYP